jgi:hypothetical protein
LSDGSEVVAVFGVVAMMLPDGCSLHGGFLGGLGEGVSWNLSTISY